MIGTIVGRRAQPGHGDQLADHLLGGDLVLDDVARRDRRRCRPRVGQPLRPRAETLRFALDDHDDEVLGTVQGDGLKDDRRAHRAHVGELAVQAEDTELGEVDADRAGRHPVETGDGHRRGFPEVVLPTALGFHRDLRRHGADAQSSPEELVVAALPRPQVEGPQRRPASKVGEVRRLMDPLGAFVEQRLLDVTLALLQPLAEPLDRVGELLRPGLAAVKPLPGHRQRRQQRHDQEHRRTEEGEHRQPADQRQGRRDHRESTRLRLGRDVAEWFEGPRLDDDRLVRGAPERDLAELVAFAVGAPAEDTESDRSRPELDDVVGTDDRGFHDRVAVDDDWIRRLGVGHGPGDEIVVDDDRQLVVGDGDVIEVHRRARRPTDVVAPRQEHERAAGLRSCRHVTAHRFGQRLTVERVDAVQLEAKRVAGDDATLDDRQLEGDAVTGPLEVYRLTGVPVAVTELTRCAEKVADRVIRLDFEAQVGGRHVAPTHPDQQLHLPIPTASSGANGCAAAPGNLRLGRHVPSRCRPQ